MKRGRIERLLLLVLVCVLTIDRAHGEIQLAQFKDDLNAIARFPSRIVGSEGYDAAADELERRISKIPNVEWKKQAFGVMAPVTRSATIDAGAGRVERIYPFWPAQVRVCSTPPEGIAGKLVYAGECRSEQIRPASLKGQIAVIEASADERWTQASYAGAKAILILGSTQTSWANLRSHDLRIPINLPRFYIPPGKLADDLRAGKIPSATLKATVTWQRKIARNYFALVRPAQRMAKDWSGNQPAAALMFSVPFDSTSLVPDLSPGAGQAVNTAAGLSLLRAIAAHPWNRPMVVFFSGADGVQFLGTRNMFLALGDPPDAWRDELVELDRQREDAQRDLARAKEIAASPRDLSIVNDRRLISRILQIIDADLAQQQDALFRLRSANGSADARASLEQRQVLLNHLKFAFQQKPDALADASLNEEAKRDIARIMTRLGGSDHGEGLIQRYASRKQQLNDRIDLYHWLADAEGREKDPAKDQTGHRLIELLVGVDLSDRGTRAGPMFIGFFQRASAMSQIQLYNDWFSQLQLNVSAHQPGAAWWNDIASSIDLGTLNQTRAPMSYLAGPLPVASELAQAWGTPGFSMITLDDLRLRRDTPNDTLENLNVDAIVPQVAGIEELFAHAWNDPKFRGPGELKRLDVSFTGQTVSASPGRPVPDLPREGFLATYYYISNTGKDKKIPPLAAMPWTLGIRRNEVVDSDAEGNYRFEGLPRVRADQLLGNTRAQNDMQTFAVNVYRIDPASGAITATTDLGKQAGDIRWSADIKEKVLPIRSLAFDCEEFALTGLYDPRFLQTLGEVALLDARRNAEPQRFGAWLDNQMMAGFVEPGLAIDLLFRYGRVGNRVVLINGPDGRGYTPTALNNLGALALATSRDFYQLDDRRLADYRRAGVSSSLIDKLHVDAHQQLQSAGQSFNDDDGVGLLRSSTGAWANEARVYDAAQNMAHDVVRAAIFLLMLCVPFSFVMERLLIGTPSVYKQIAGMSIIFSIMTAALATFHPAFKISASPLIIILAFAIIAMSSLVIMVIYGRFDAELKRLLSGRGSAHGARVASASVMMSAVLLGIANMRKRKFRTLLTSITIVLITFAVLCFTSTTRYVGTQTLATGVASSHPGILLRQRGFRMIEPVLPDQLRAVLADPALKFGATPAVVERWWADSVNDPKEQYNLTSASSPVLHADVAKAKEPTAESPAGKAGRTVAVPGVLGLTPGESKLSRIAEIIGKEKFGRLESGDQRVIYLSDSTAKDLNVREGDAVRLGGIDLQIAGIYSADAFDRDVLMLGGESLSPLKYTTGLLDAGGQKMTETGADTTDLAGNSSAAEAGTVYEHLSASQFVIVPASVCRQLFNSSLRSVAFGLGDQDQVKRISDELARRFAMAMYAGFDDGVRMVSAANLSSVSGASQVAIPLVIAGLIIFNTMMGSIAERRREIHVYTSLGLAPMHVGALFVAEAMTYGLVGTIFGYIIGQGAGTALQKLGWLGGATLNYSGSSAMLTIGLILFIVFLSALVPARLASKIAAPSIDRTWQVPAPDGDRICAVLPFTINRTAANGALAYLAEFFDEHREGSIGKFSADRVQAVPSGLTTTIWLTPYDLGIRQQLTLLIHPGEFQDIYEVQVQLERLSGDDGSWHRMNKTFLTELRKQFLQWRSLSPARMSGYVQASKARFATG